MKNNQIKTVLTRMWGFVLYVALAGMPSKDRPGGPPTAAPPYAKDCSCRHAIEGPPRRRPPDGGPPRAAPYYY